MGYEQFFDVYRHWLGNKILRTAMYTKKSETKLLITFSKLCRQHTCMRQCFRGVDAAVLYIREFCRIIKYIFLAINPIGDMIKRREVENGKKRCPIDMLHRLSTDFSNTTKRLWKNSMTSGFNFNFRQYSGTYSYTTQTRTETKLENNCVTL